MASRWTGCWARRSRGRSPPRSWWSTEKVDHVGTLSLRFAAVAQPAHNDTLGWMDVMRVVPGGATFTEQ